MSNTIVELNDQKFVVYAGDDKIAKIVPLGMGYDSGVSCPPIPPSVCSPGYEPSCVNGTVWCEWEPN